MRNRKDDYNPTLILTNGVLALALVLELTLIVMGWCAVATATAGFIMAVTWIAFIAGRGGDEAIAALCSTFYFLAVACSLFNYNCIHYLGVVLGIIGIVVQIMMSVARSDGRI
jgi:hypothetical protein